MALDANTLKNKANGIMSGFSPGQRVVLIIAVVTLVAGGVFFTQWASKPTMVPLYSNLSADDASQITTKLSSSGTKYELADGGATILVPSSSVYQNRLDMAGEGLPTGGTEGYKLLDKQGITTSQFLEHVDYQRALEGELSKTISSINDVTAATVHLVIPQDDVFTDDAKKPSASVLVETAPGKNLSSTQVRAVVNLVASGVEGLTSDNVTVADNKGNVLAAPGQAITGAGGDGQGQASTALETDLNNKIQALLTPVVGANKAVVQTRAELNWDQEQQTSEVYNPDNKPVTPLSQRETSEIYNNSDGTAATGCIGTETPADTSGVCNTPTTGTGTGGYTKKDTAQDNGVDKTVTQTVKSPGTVERLSVAVLVDSTVPNIDKAEIESLVTQAAGLQPARGDAVTVSSMPFDTSGAQAAEEDLKAAEKAKKQAEMMTMIKTGGTFLVILIVVLVLFFVTKKKAKAYSATPISIAELDAAMPALASGDMLAALDSASINIEDNTPEALERAKVDKEISGLIEKQPDEVAGLLRSWLADRRS